MNPIVYIDRASGEEVQEKVPSGTFLKFLYTHPFGILSLNLLFKRKLVSRVGGWFMNTRYSASKIEGFLEEHQMDLNHYFKPTDGYRTFNDFFYRKVKPEFRPIGEDLVSPADGKMVAFNSIKESEKFFVKGSLFNTAEFLNSIDLAKDYKNGGLAIIRLAPTDYHRYHFPAAGKAGPSHKVKGNYLSVSPIALQQSISIFLTNKREFTELETEQFGKIVVADVGATMVGSIEQTYEFNSRVEKGQEKGYFAFGGSTIVLLTQDKKIKFSDDLIENSARGIETALFMGDTIGKAFA